MTQMYLHKFQMIPVLGLCAIGWMIHPPPNNGDGVICTSDVILGIAFDIQDSTRIINHLKDQCHSDGGGPLG